MASAATIRESVLAWNFPEKTIILEYPQYAFPAPSHSSSRRVAFARPGLSDDYIGILTSAE